MKKKFVYQVGNNKKVILWCTANQISTLLLSLLMLLQVTTSNVDILWWATYSHYVQWSGRFASHRV